MTPKHVQPPALEILQDSEGSVTMGWVGDGVFYARFVDGLSAGVGMAHVKRLQELIGGVPSLSYFSDASGLNRYDLVARSAFARLVLENRRKFSALVMLTWSAGATPAAAAFVAAVGNPVTLLTDATEFDKLLVAAAPLARQRLDPRTWARAPAPGVVRR
jgi:hypothetical protein